MPWFQSRAQRADLFSPANYLAKEKFWTVYYSSPNFHFLSVKGFSFPCCVKTYMLLTMVADPELQFSTDPKHIFSGEIPGSSFLSG